MVRSLLVALDGSPQAEEALLYGLTLASRTAALLYLLLVIDPTSHLTDFRQRRELGRETTWAHVYLDRKRRELEDLGVEARTQVAHGQPAYCILRWAERWEVDMVALADEPPSAPAPWAKGAVAQRIAQWSQCPVLLVRPGQRALWPPRRILLLTDGSALSRAALPVARELAQALGSVLVLAQVVAVEGLSEEAHPWLEKERQRALACLREEARRLEREGVKAIPQAVVGHPVSSILALAQEVGAGLIVLSTHGRGGGPWPLGSVAHAILQRSPLPCLLVRPRELSHRLSPDVD
jgi:nucleotide-binding universal stress UspA family protein